MSKMKRFPWPVGVAGAACAVALVAAAILPTGVAGGVGPDGACGLTTLDATLVATPQGTLACGPGQALKVRSDLRSPKAARAQTRTGLLSFLAMADPSIVDEESPLRTEFADACPSWPAAGSFRPQETMIPALVNANIAAASAIASSPTGSPEVHVPYSFFVQLGDGANNQQHNEQQTLGSLLKGKLVDTDSGKDGYEGAQTADPAAGSPALASPVSGMSLRDLGNEAFDASGLSAQGWPMRAMRVIGQRDVHAGGWMPTDEHVQTVANAFATGQLKIASLGSQRVRAVCEDPSVLSSTEFWTGVAADPTVVRLVSADADRRLADRAAWIEDALGTTAGKSRCTGFGDRVLPRACYSWDQEPFHFIALDTVPDDGSGHGNVDIEQAVWLEQQLIASSSSYVTESGETKKTNNTDRLVVIFSDHGSDMLVNDTPTKPAMEGGDLERMLLRFPNVVLHVASKSARPGVIAHGTGKAGYWEIQSTSASAWPAQSRSIEIADNHDGTLSIFGVLFDAAAPPNARALQWNDDPTDEHAMGQARHVNEAWLASAAREIALHDPQRPQAPAASARNVELVLTHPWGVTKSPLDVVHTPRVPFTPPTVPSFGSGFPTSFPPGFPGGVGPNQIQPPQQFPQPQQPFYRTTEKGLAVRPTAGDAGYATRVILLLLASAAGASWLIQARVRRWMVGI